MYCIDSPRLNPLYRSASFVLQGKNITLRGRGIIEGGTIASRQDRRYTILVQDSEDVTLEGVIIHDPSHWTVPIKRCVSPEAQLETDHE